MKELELFLSYTNSDLTEGRGKRVPIAVCETLSTAERMSLKKGVMGTDAYTEKIDVIYKDNVLYVPLSCVKYEKAAEEDLRNEKKKEVVEKAKSLGLSDEEINLMVKK